MGPEVQQGTQGGSIEIRSDGDCILGTYEHILTHVDLSLIMCLFLETVTEWVCSGGKVWAVWETSSIKH